MKDSKTKAEEFTHLTYTGLRHSDCHGEDLCDEHDSHTLGCSRNWNT
jgi:hypothetical protein